MNDAPMKGACKLPELQACAVSLCNLLVRLLHAPSCTCKHIWHLLTVHIDCAHCTLFCTPASLVVYLCVCSGVAHFSLTYGLRNTGMNYDRAMFGMKLPDCRSVAKMLEKSETLVTLALPGNLLEDDKIRMIASGLVDNHSVTDLDLSHNKVISSQKQASILFKIVFTHILAAPFANALLTCTTLQSDCAHSFFVFKMFHV